MFLLLTAALARDLSPGERLGLQAAAESGRAELPAARKAAIRVLERRVRKEPTPDDLLRLAELWQEDADTAELRALSEYVARYDACHDRPGCDLSALAPDLTAADSARERATVRYRQLLRDFPDAEGVDAAAYGLGWAWRAMGDDALGDAAFTWLVAARPQSPYAAHAWLLVGERAFEAWDADWARQAYSHVVATDDPLRPWALHRLAWAYYRLGDYAGAIDTMKRVVGTELEEAALKDLVRFYADAGEEMETVGCALGRREAVVSLLVRLADTYAQQGRFDAAIQSWRRLIAEAPDAAEVPGYQARIVETYRNMGRWREATDELDRLLRYTDARPANPAAAANLERQLRSLAFEVHRSASDRERLSLATKLYALHAERFPAADAAPDIAWAWAVALETLGESTLAAEKFAALAAADPTGRYARDAAEAAARLRR